MAAWITSRNPLMRTGKSGSLVLTGASGLAGSSSGSLALTKSPHFLQNGLDLRTDSSDLHSGHVSTAVPAPGSFDSTGSGLAGSGLTGSVFVSGSAGAVDDEGGVSCCGVSSSLHQSGEILRNAGALTSDPPLRSIAVMRAGSPPSEKKLGLKARYSLPVTDFLPASLHSTRQY